MAPPIELSSAMILPPVLDVVLTQALTVSVLPAFSNCRTVIVPFAVPSKVAAVLPATAPLVPKLTPDSASASPKPPLA